MTVIVILTSFFAGIVYGELFRRLIRRRSPTVQCSQGYDYEVTKLPEQGRICINCGWFGKESECLDWKHPTGERFCPECHEVTEAYECDWIDHLNDELTSDRSGDA